MKVLFIIKERIARDYKLTPAKRNKSKRFHLSLVNWTDLALKQFLEKIGIFRIRRRISNILTEHLHPVENDS